MMERMLLGVFCLAGLHIFSPGLPDQYYYVDESLNWTEAQTYCREKYTDLVTTENSGDMDQLFNTVLSSGYSYEVWIGLYGSVDWRWSDGYNGSGADYRNWGPNEPDDHFCVAIEKSASGSFSWVARDCGSVYEVICELGTPTHPYVTRMSLNRTLTDAESYCWNDGRLAKLPTIIDHIANNNIQKVITKTAWIGLRGRPSSSWSNGSNSTFRDWVEGSDPAGFNSAKGLCGAVNLEGSQKWNLSRCERRLPFVCYGAPKPTAVKSHVIKLRMKPDDPSVSLNDPAVRAQILEKLQDKLKENQMSGVSLKWREQPDGNAFLKEMKIFSEEIGKEN